MKNNFQFESILKNAKGDNKAFPKLGNVLMLPNQKNLSKDNKSATGTPNNDAYQEIRNKTNVIDQKQAAIYQAMGDSTLTDDQKLAKQKETGETAKAVSP